MANDENSGLFVWGVGVRGVIPQIAAGLSGLWWGEQNLEAHG